MAELLEQAAPTITPTVDNTPDVLDRLADKSKAKIEATVKVQEERKAPAAPTAETVDTLKKATDIVADEPKKDGAVLSAEEKAKADLIANEAKIASEKAANAEILAKATELVEGQEEAKIEKNHWEEEVVPAAEVKTDDKEVAKKYETKAKEYEDLTSKPLIAAYIAAEKAGKDLPTFLNEVKGEDIKALSNEQVWERELKSANLTPEQVTEEMDSFKALSPYQQKKQTDPVRAQLDAAQTERLKQYASDNTAAAANNTKVAQQLLQEKEQYLNSKKGKVEMGLEMTPARLQEVSDYVDNFNLQRADGSVDVSRIARLGMLEKNYKLLLQNAYTKGANDERIKALKEIARPSREDGALRIVPDQRSAAKKDVEAFRNEIHA